MHITSIPHQINQLRVPFVKKKTYNKNSSINFTIKLTLNENPNQGQKVQNKQSTSQQRMV